MTPAAEALVLEYLPLVHTIARRTKKILPAWVEFEELVSCGTLGLMEAATRFDPAQRSRFESYASPRIRGAILDAFTGKRYPVCMLALDGGGIVHDETKPDLQVLDERETVEQTLVSEAESTSRCIHITLAVRNLTKQERQAISAFASGKTLVEVGAKFGRSKSWAFSMVSSARRKLQRQLGAYAR